MRAGQNRYLAARYQMFCKRDAVYLENLAAEKRAEEGETPSGKMPPYMARITDVKPDAAHGQYQAGTKTISENP